MVKKAIHLYLLLLKSMMTSHEPFSLDGHMNE